MTKIYHNGPVADDQRKKTDCFCAVVLILFNLIIFGLAIYAWTSSNFSKMTTPYDPDGKGCGVDYPEYPFIYFASPHSDSLYVTTCVKKCPLATDKVLECKPNSIIKSCEPVNSADNLKAVQIYETTPIRGIICMPAEDKIKSEVYAALGAEAAQQKVASLSKAWVIILISLPVCVLLSVLFFFLMRITASFFVYLLFFAAIISLIGFGIYLLISPADQSVTAGLFHSNMFSYVIGAICIILAVAIAIALICFRQKLNLASSIVKVSTRFVHENCPVMFLQVALFIVMTIFVVLWFFEALGFYSMGEPQYQTNSLPFQHFQSNWKIKLLGFVHIFYLFWSMVFFVQSGDFLVAGTVTSWYFQRENPYKQSIHRYFSFHFGSVCLGSFFIALFGFIKFVYEILAPKQEDKDDGIFAACSKFWKCFCCICVNYVFNFINSGAYTFIHLAGDSYCTSAAEVLAVRIKDMVLTSVVTILSVFFQILIRVGITALTCLVAYVILRNVEPYKTEANDTTLIMIVVGLIGFTISSLFVSLYSQAMESISVCYLIDKDAGGGQDKCPDELKDFLNQAKIENHTEMKP